jgi:hypothetical protein
VKSGRGKGHRSATLTEPKNCSTRIGQKYLMLLERGHRPLCICTLCVLLEVER